MPSLSLSLALLVGGAEASLAPTSRGHAAQALGGRTLLLVQPVSQPVGAHSNTDQAPPAMRPASSLLLFLLLPMYSSLSLSLARLCIHHRQHAGRSHHRPPPRFPSPLHTAYMPSHTHPILRTTEPSGLPPPSIHPSSLCIGRSRAERRVELDDDGREERLVHLQSPSRPWPAKAGSHTVTSPPDSQPRGRR